MIVRHLELIQFRNYEKVSIDFSEHTNLLTGFNAQGKTNLLESLVYLSLTRSHRISDEKKLIRENCDFASVSCIYEDEGNVHTLKAVIHKKGKTLFADGHPVSKSSEFIGLLNTVLFSPDDLGIFNDSPKKRRRMINQEITKVSFSYLSSLNKYQSYLKQRNAVLKNEVTDHSLLDIMDEQMALCESVILQERYNFIHLINQYISRIYQILSDEKSEIRLHYVSCYENNSEEYICNTRKKYRNKDCLLHMTTIGIHREDFIFLKDEKNIIECASQGQKRMILLAFKMSLLIYIKERIHKRPVLLLDDVMSELDHNRQKKLLELLDDKYQCVITATDIPDYLKSRNYREFHICNGSIESIKEEVK